MVLSLGAKRPHKNQALLVRALPHLPEDVRIVLAGHAEPYEATVRGLAMELGVADRVVFTEWVDDRALEGLWSVASVAAFPTLAEGFGLPLLEAMARGVPVAASDIPVFRETAGTWPRYFNPGSGGRRPRDHGAAGPATGPRSRPVVGGPLQLEGCRRGHLGDLRPRGDCPSCGGAPALMHVGLNLVFLVPGETGGTEVYARELIPELVAAAPDVRFTAFVNREAAAVADGAVGRADPGGHRPGPRAQPRRVGSRRAAAAAARSPPGPASTSSTASPTRRPRGGASGASSRFTTSTTGSCPKRTSACAVSACACSCRWPRAARTGSSSTRPAPGATSSGC